MFSGEDIDKKVSVLSGGEKTRLAMVRLLLTPVNLLILDEPTNHLDIRTKEILKQAIKDFDGTAIIVSHDREFLDGLATRVLEFRNRKIKEHLGGIYEFLEDRRIENLNELNAIQPAKQQVKQQKAEPAKAVKEEVKPDSKLSFEQQKELARKKNKLEKQLKQAEESIEQLETQIAELEDKMSNCTSSEALAMTTQYMQLKEELDKQMKDWEDIGEQLADL